MSEHKEDKFMTLGEIQSHISREPSYPMIGSHEKRASSVVRERPAGFLLMATWFALIAGFAELLVLTVRKFVLHQMLFVGPQVAWMAPLSYLVFFAGLGLGLCFVAWRWPWLISLRTTVFLFTFLGTFSFLFLYYPQLHKLAILLLATGLAVQAARLIAAHPEGFHRLVNRTVGWMVALVVGLGVGVHGWGVLVERHVLATLPPASPDAPNVLLIVLDTVRAQSLSLYGYARPTTPQLERFAKQGVLFERAITTAPWTTPSHASMFTGRWPHELSAEWVVMKLRPLDTTYPTLAEVLRAHGYVTAGFVANVEYCGYETGLKRGFVHYKDYPLSPGEIILSSSLGRFITNSPRLRRLVGYYDLLSRKTAAQVNDAFLRWLSRQDRRPFFAFLNYFDAHEPYLPPQPFDVMFGPMRTRGPFVHMTNRAWRADKWAMSPQEILVELDAYEGAIAYLDQQLGLLLNELEKRDVFENMLVIITSDHGEQFGEQGLFGHVNSLYLPLLHVPLLIVFPLRVPEGKQVSEPVSLRSLPATVVDLVGLADRSPFPGSSLSRHWQTTNGTRSPLRDIVLSEVNRGFVEQEWYPIAKGNMKSLMTDRHHYIKGGDGREELYDFENDPLENHNLAKSKEGRLMLARFRTSLEKILVRNRLSN